MRNKNSDKRKNWGKGHCNASTIFKISVLPHKDSSQQTRLDAHLATKMEHSEPRGEAKEQNEKAIPLA